MIADNALANFCNSSELRRGGDTGMRRAEHRSFTRDNIHSLYEMGHAGRTSLLTGQSIL